jgi:hypothetical protein
MRKRGILLLGVCIIALSGCGNKRDVVSAALNSYIEQSIMSDSNIEEDQNFQQYEKLSQEKRINNEGFYTSDEVDYSAVEDADAIHVTFAKNSYMTIQYFDDPALTNELDAENGVYLHQGDCIYAKVLEVLNPSTEAYFFDGFEVWEFDETGKKRQQLQSEEFQNDLVYQIPAEYNGGEIAIVPLGKFADRTITFRAFCVDNNGVEQDGIGSWIINGNEVDGDSISINAVETCTAKYKYDVNSYEYVNSSPKCLNNDAEAGFVEFEEYEADQNHDSFTVELRRKNNNIEFDPGKYKTDYCTIEFSYQGQVINDKISVPSRSKIGYEIKNVEKGYWVPSGNEKGELEVEKIKDVTRIVCKEEKVIVSLPQPDKGGTITYSINGKNIEGEKAEVLIGSEISMVFNCKNGWSCTKEDGITYTVSAAENQRINVGGDDVNNIFFEKEYKPEVTLRLEKSIGTYTEFTLSGVDVDQSNLKLDEEKAKDVFKQEMGTKNDLTISASNGTLLDGEAIKLEIKKETTAGTKETDIQYLPKLPNTIKVSLYIEDNSTVYKTVKITASKVKVVAFSSPKIANGYITVKTTDITANRILKVGDVIEDSRKVEVTVTPKKGYYVKDSGKTENYVDKVKYSKYVSDITNTLAKHPIKKLYNITLDGTDPCGVVSYKIDGKAVEYGSYNLKEEQKLEMKYEITDGQHVIVRETSNWMSQTWNKTKSTTKETVTVPIIASLDNEKVTRDKYIAVANK